MNPYSRANVLYADEAYWGHAMSGKDALGVLDDRSWGSHGELSHLYIAWVVVDDQQVFLAIPLEQVCSNVLKG